MGESVRRYATVAAAAIILACGLALDVAVADGGTVTTLSGQLRADALSAYMLTVVGAVALTATWGGMSRRSQPPPSATYTGLVVLFLAAMSLGVLADNLGVLWVAVEATTIATAFLVGHHRTRGSLEAAWK
jgi:hydrogenase-4 component F